MKTVHDYMNTLQGEDLYRALVAAGLAKSMTDARLQVAVEQGQDPR